MVEEDKGVSGDNGCADSHFIWSIGKGGRIGYGNDQKSYKRDAGNILVARAADDRYFIQQNTFDEWEGQGDCAIFAGRGGRSAGQVSLTRAAVGSVHRRTDRMRGV